jgi:hypothetical protein
MCDQLPSGSVLPTTTNSSWLRHFDFTQIPRSLVHSQAASRSIEAAMVA